jgi:hypothetical protein
MGVRLLYLRVSSRELIVRRKLAEISSHHFVVQVLKFDSKEALALFFFSEQARLRYVVVRLFFFLNSLNRRAPAACHNVASSLIMPCPEHHSRIKYSRFMITYTMRWHQCRTSASTSERSPRLTNAWNRPFPSKSILPIDDMHESRANQVAVYMYS